MLKLLNAFIEPLPGKFCSKVDGKVHCSFNQLGARTGRCSCTEPNLQQVPAKSKDIRMMFEASTEYFDTEEKDNCFEVNKVSDVLLSSGEWLNVKDVKVGMELVVEDEIMPTVSRVERVEEKENSILIYVA